MLRAGNRTYRVRVLPICFVALGIAWTVFSASQPARAAAPWIIIVHGGSLDEPVTLPGIRQNGMILGSPHADPGSNLDERPYFELALFWGPDWAAFLDSGQSPATLSPDQANQRGKFYPAFGNDEALLTLTRGDPPVRQPSPEGLEILQAQGVPIRLDSAPSDRIANLGEPVWWFIAAALVLLIGSAIVARRRDPARRMGADLAPRGW